MFSPTVTDSWTPHRSGQAELEVGQIRVVVDDALPANRSVSVLELVDGGGVVTLTAAHAARLGLTSGSGCTALGVLEGLRRAGVVMNDPDHLFYLPVAEQLDVSRNAAVTAATRQLEHTDNHAFRRLEAAAPDHDLDEAFVELDHWLAFGSFEDSELVCAASMIPWRGTNLADLGVLTLPQYRGRGLATRTVRALSACALSNGYEPQYRCQIDNEPSVALAAAAGFSRYGTWRVIDSDE